MLNRLKEAHYRRKFGPERAALIVQAERKLAALPKRAISQEESGRLWNLSPDWWLEGVEFFRERSVMLAERNTVVQIITRKNKLLNVLESSEGPVPPEIERAYQETAKQVERTKAEIMVRERRVRDFGLLFAEPPSQSS